MYTSTAQYYTKTHIRIMDNNSFSFQTIWEHWLSLYVCIREFLVVCLKQSFFNPTTYIHFHLTNGNSPRIPCPNTHTTYTYTTFNFFFVYTLEIYIHKLECDGAQFRFLKVWESIIPFYVVFLFCCSATFSLLILLFVVGEKLVLNTQLFIFVPVYHEQSHNKTALVHFFCFHFNHKYWLFSMIEPFFFTFICYNMV